MVMDTIAAIRELNEHPDTIFTVLTGEGRFFSAGADVRGKHSSYGLVEKADERYQGLLDSVLEIHRVQHKPR